jgi:hypothetical protein
MAGAYDEDQRHAYNELIRTLRWRWRRRTTFGTGLVREVTLENANFRFIILHLRSITTEYVGLRGDGWT